MMRYGLAHALASHNVETGIIVAVLATLYLLYDGLTRDIIIMALQQVKSLLWGDSSVMIRALAVCTVHCVHAGRVATSNRSSCATVVDVSLRIPTFLKYTVPKVAKHVFTLPVYTTPCFTAPQRLPDIGDFDSELV